MRTKTSRWRSVLVNEICFSFLAYTKLNTDMIIIRWWLVGWLVEFIQCLMSNREIIRWFNQWLMRAHLMIILFAPFFYPHFVLWSLLYIFYCIISPFPISLPFSLYYPPMQILQCINQCIGLFVILIGN